MRTSMYPNSLGLPKIRAPNVEGRQSHTTSAPSPTSPRLPLQRLYQ